MYTLMMTQNKIFKEIFAKIGPICIFGKIVKIANNMKKKNSKYRASCSLNGLIVNFFYQLMFSNLTWLQEEDVWTCCSHIMLWPAWPFSLILILLSLYRSNRLCIDNEKKISFIYCKISHFGWLTGSLDTYVHPNDDSEQDLQRNFC
jgi:PIN domain nuclease of toxin-antitoxin system